MCRTALPLLVALVLSAATGCEKPGSPSGGGTSASATASASAVPSALPPASAMEPAPPPPDDLNVAALQKALKCPADPKTGPCRVLAAFATCKEWNAVSPSGDGRWLGRGYGVEGAKTSEQFTIVRSKRVPSAEVARGQLPVKIAITDVPKEEAAAFDQAERAIRAYERSDVPPRSNPTIEYIKKRADWPEEHASRTKGGQVFVNQGGGAFACQGAKQQLLVIQRSSSAGDGGDGLYAELWATTW
jgi:hypothetical protein